MNGKQYEPLKALLRSEDPEEIQRGLELAARELRRVMTADALVIVDTVTPLFYIDPLDRPELAPMLDQAITLVASVGEPVIPMLVSLLDLGDLKAQIASGQALGRIGTKAIDPLIQEYHASTDPTRRSLILYALAKINSREIRRAAPMAAEAARSRHAELRDTALRAMGKFAESIPSGELDPLLRDSFVRELTAQLFSPSPQLRAKAFRSLGKMARFNHLKADQVEHLAAACRAALGADGAEWDRVYLVRKEAEEALRHCAALLETVGREH